MKQIDQREIEGLVSALAAKVDAEGVRDTIGTALMAGANITITVNDAGDTITIAAAGSSYTDEQARDAIGAALVAGTGMTITIDDAGDTITLASTATSGGGGGGGTFAGVWTAAPEELVWTQSFASDTTPFTGSNTRIAMSSAVGSGKPAFDYVDEATASINGSAHVLQQLSLADITAMAGRTPTKLRLRVGYRQRGNANPASRTGNYSLLLNGTAVWSKSITTTLANQVIDGAWETVEITAGFSTTNSFACQISGGFATAIPQGWIDVTGFELFAVVVGWAGYDMGQVVVYKGSLYKSLAAANFDEPTVGAGAASWSLVPLYATPKTPNAQTGTTYTLVLDDVSKVVTLTNAAAIALTVPTDATAAFPIGTRITVIQGGAGGVTFTPAAGVTINNNSALAGQWQKAELVKTGTDTWVRLS